MFGGCCCTGTCRRLRSGLRWRDSWENKDCHRSSGCWHLADCQARRRASALNNADQPLLPKWPASLQGFALEDIEPPIRRGCKRSILRRRLDQRSRVGIHRRKGSIPTGGRKRRMLSLPLATAVGAGSLRQSAAQRSPSSSLPSSQTRTPLPYQEFLLFPVDGSKPPHDLVATASNRAIIGTFIGVFIVAIIATLIVLITELNISVANKAITADCSLTRCCTPIIREAVAIIAGLQPASPGASSTRSP